MPSGAQAAAGTLEDFPAEFEVQGAVGGPELVASVTSNPHSLRPRPRSKKARNGSTPPVAPGSGMGQVGKAQVLDLLPQSAAVLGAQR